MPLDGAPPEATLRAGLAALEGGGLHVAQISRFFRTPCFPAGAGPDYINAAARLEVAGGIGPADVLARLHAVEAAHGRTRETRWGMRTLDLDLVAWGDSVLPDAATHARWRTLPPEAQARQAPAELILPHPRLQDRVFVLVPLADVAGDWTHPVSGQSVAQMLRALPPADREAVKPL